MQRLSPAKLKKLVARTVKERGLKPNDAKDALAREFIAEANEDRHDAELTVLSFGGGVDSTSILMRWCEEGFEKFGVDPKNLLVVMAQTGNEYPDLAELVEDHLLPRLAQHGVRFVQVARVDSSHQDEFVVLDDSRAPTKLHIEGAFQLRDEMLAAGTLPQSGGTRLCSIKSKGWPLDAFILKHAAGRPFAHVIGFEAEELGRALKDVHCGESNRRPWYPLIDWNWNRAKCLDYIESVTGVRWAKSACHFCPFAGQGVEKSSLATRWEKYPELAADSLIMERTAQSLNSTQTLFGGRRLTQNHAWDHGSAIKFCNQRGLTGAVEAYREKLSTMTWAVYRVQRIWRSNTTANRSISIEFKGNRAEAEAELRRIAAAENVEVVVEGPGHDIHRAVHSEKPTEFPGVEELLVAAPMTMVTEKHSVGAKTTTREEFAAAAQKAGGRLRVLSDISCEAA